MKFWNDMDEKTSLNDSDVLMVGDSTDTTHPKHSTFSTIISWVKAKLSLTTLTAGNLPIAASDGTLADSGQRPILYISQYAKSTNNVHPHAVYDSTLSTPGAVISVYDTDGTTLKEMSSFVGKASFWFAAIQDNTGKEVYSSTGSGYSDSYTLEGLQDKPVYLKYLVSGVTSYPRLYIRNSVGSDVAACIKDVYGKTFEIAIKGDYTFAVGVINGTVEDELISTTTVVDTTPISLTTAAPTHTITGSEASDKIATSSAADGTGTIVLPTTLTANFSTTLHISVDSNAITINSSLYYAGQDVNLYWKYSSDGTSTWRVVAYESNNADDYTNAIVKCASAQNITIASLSDDLIDISELNWATIDNIAKESLILLSAQTDKSQIGIYKWVSSAIDSGVSEITFRKVASYSEILTVKVENKYNDDDLKTGLWQNEYDGANTTTLAFERLSDKADAATVTTALAAKADLVRGKIPASELPSYVDDVVEGYYSSSVFYSDSALTTAITGETGKIYVDLTTNTSYRYTGSTYVRIDEVDVATTTAAGLLSAADKTKLDALDENIASDSDFETGTDNSKRTTVLGIFTGFKYWLVNATISALTTTSQTITGAINELVTKLNSVATDADVVHLTGAETITGSKTFSATSMVAPIIIKENGYGTDCINMTVAAGKGAVCTLGLNSSAAFQATAGGGPINVGVAVTNSGYSTARGFYGTGTNPNLLELANTSATSYSRILFTGTGHRFTTGVGNASETTYGLANSFYIFDLTNTTVRLKIDSAGNFTLPSLTTAGIVTNTAGGVLGTTATVPIENGGTNATTAAAALTNLGAAASGANSDITSLTGLTTPLSISQGGTNSSIQNFVDLTTNQVKSGTLTATEFITSGATSSQFVKGDGSLDSTTYQSTTLTENKIWVGSSSGIATENSTIMEWVTGAISPGQKEVKSLVTEMIVADGSIIAIPVIFHKTISLTTATTIQLLADTYSGRYYVIDGIAIIARSPSFTQYPIVSIGNNSSNYNNIVASTTLSSLAAGRNALTLTTAAQGATIEAASTLYLNITQAALGSGSFEIIIRGYLTNL